MLVSEFVEVKLNGKKIKHYEELGYILPKRKTKDGMCVPKNAIINIKIEDVPKNSHIEVIVKCDYCGKEYPTRYDGYNTRKENDINLDCCEECKPLKNKELNMLRYGVENQFQREEIKNNLEYFYMNSFGSTHPMRNADIKEKAMKTMSDNNGIECSRQQIYLCKLFNGKLNFVDNSTKGFAIDIALVDKKIAIEFAGSGHNLQVKFGNMTAKEFENKEIVRYQILKRNGWKQIHINSNQDYLPSDEVLLKEYNQALEWFNSSGKGHSHYNINIGNKINDVKFGKLRKIKEKDLKEVG
jgi:hypothetical protein